MKEILETVSHPLSSAPDPSSGGQVAIDGAAFIPEPRNNSKQLSDGMITITSFKSAQLQVLNHLASGLSNNEMAEEMGISVNTVKAHLKIIYSIFGLRSRTAVLVKAIKLGIVQVKGTCPFCGNVGRGSAQRSQMH